MDTVISATKNMATSARLVYKQSRANDDGLQAWFQEHMVNDPETFILGCGMLWKPRDRPMSNSVLLDTFPNALLAVLICVPAAALNPEEAAATYTDADGDKVIGFVTLHAASQFTQQNHASSLTIGIMRGYQNAGYGAEAMQWTVDWGFRFGNLHRISLSTCSFNERAIAVYKKIGFVEEGRARETVFFDRRYYDTVSLGILVREWELMREEKEELAWGTFPSGN